MKTGLMLLLISVILFHKSSAQKFEWLRSSSTSWNNSEAMHIETDAAGNVFVAGSFSGFMVNGSDTIYSYQSSMCSFLSKFDSNGNHLWSKPFAPVNGKPNDVCIDSGGNIYMSMLLYFNTTYIDEDTTFNFSTWNYLVSFDNDGKLRWAIPHPLGSSQMPVTSSIQHSGFFTASGNSIYRFDENGNLLWTRTATGSAAANFLIRGLDCNDGSTLIACGITGSFTTGVVTMDTVSVSIANDLSDMAFFRLDFTGGVQWGIVQPDLIEGAYWNIIHKMLVGPASEFYYLYIKPPNTLNYNLGNDTLFNPYCPTCSYAGVFKYDSSGNPLWARNGFIGDFLIAEPYDFTFNDDFDIILSANSNAGNNYFGNNYFNNAYGLGAYNTLLVGKITSQGNYGWLKTDYRLRGQLVYDYVSSIAKGLNNSVHIAGKRNLGLSPSFNLGCLSDNSNTATGTDYFLANISENTEPTPAVNFDFQIDGLAVYFENKSDPGATYQWNFGDSQTSALANPTNNYANVGSYSVCLTAENNCGQSQICKDVILEGLDYVSPSRVSSNGYHKLQVRGGFATNPTLVKFIKSGSPDIIPDTLRRTNSGLLEVNIKLTQADLGFYDLIYHSPSFSDTLVSALKVEAADSLNPYVTISGPAAIRPNWWAQMRITVTNPSNVSYYGIPVYITLPENMETFLPASDYGDTTYLSVMQQIGSQFAKVGGGTNNDSVLFAAFLLSELQPGESKVISLFVKSPTVQTCLIEAFVGPSYFSNAELAAMDLRTMAACNFLPACLECALDILGLFPPTGCAVGALNFGCSIGALPFKGASAGAFLTNVMGNAAAMALSCITGTAGPKTLFQTISNTVAIGILADVANSASSIGESCRKCDPFSADDWSIFVNNSVDPNYKSGPRGITPENYINKNDILEYIIHFENLDTATAPAAEVIIIDTLDLNVFDLSTFTFTGFGQTDSLVNFNLPLTQFACQIDLQPVKNAVLRITGNLDTLSGEVRWAFRSLDPVTTELAPGLADGFLNPNVSPPEGEGFVSFRIKPKSNINHLQTLTNKALIFFDNNAPIATNVHLNTIDTIKPSSSILPLPVNITDSVFTIKWTGSDAHAGIYRYDIYMSENDSPYLKIQSLTSGDSLVFTGANGSKYEFYSIAFDRARNIEEAPVNPDINPDASTTITVGMAEIMNDVNFSLFPNPADEMILVQLESALTEKSLIVVSDMLGKELIRRHISENQKIISVDVAELEAGIYSVSILSELPLTTRQFIKLH